VLHRFREITADLTERLGGTVVQHTGDGHLITFDGPTQAIRCAEALRADVEALGIEMVRRVGRRHRRPTVVAASESCCCDGPGPGASHF
jgi:class 3 adenylate cyclase